MSDTPKANFEVIATRYAELLKEETFQRLQLENIATALKAQRDDLQRQLTEATTHSESLERQLQEQHADGQPVTDPTDGVPE